MNFHSVCHIITLVSCCLLKHTYFTYLPLLYYSLLNTQSHRLPNAMAQTRSHSQNKPSSPPVATSQCTKCKCGPKKMSAEEQEAAQQAKCDEDMPMTLFPVILCLYHFPYCSLPHLSQSQ